MKWFEVCIYGHQFLFLNIIHEWFYSFHIANYICILMTLKFLSDVSPKLQIHASELLYFSLRHCTGTSNTNLSIQNQFNHTSLHTRLALNDYLRIWKGHLLDCWTVNQFITIHSSSPYSTNPCRDPSVLNIVMHRHISSSGRNDLDQKTCQLTVISCSLSSEAVPAETSPHPPPFWASCTQDSWVWGIKPSTLTPAQATLNAQLSYS